jgi:hypothetical protein
MKCKSAGKSRYVANAIPNREYLHGRSEVDHAGPGSIDRTIAVEKDTAARRDSFN